MGPDLLKIGRFCLELAASMMVSVLIVWAIAAFSSGLFISRRMTQVATWLRLRPADGE